MALTERVLQQEVRDCCDHCRNLITRGPSSEQVLSRGENTPRLARLSLKFGSQGGGGHGGPGPKALRKEFTTPKCDISPGNLVLPILYP